MCDLSGRLIAWMDGELPEHEAADIERHLAKCPECRERLAAYQQASGAFDAYCEAAFAKETHRNPLRWLPAAGVAATIAAAAAIAVLLMLPRERIAKAPARVTPPESIEHATTPPGSAQRDDTLEAAGTPSSTQVKRVPHRSAAMSARIQTAKAAPRQQLPQAQDLRPFPSEPPIEIAVPGDAVFPPGAVPPGMSFTADLTISADGSPEQLGLRPRIAAFERRANQP
jgi:hypothetical protein